MAGDTKNDPGPAIATFQCHPRLCRVGLRSLCASERKGPARRMRPLILFSYKSSLTKGVPYLCLNLPAELQHHGSSTSSARVGFLSLAVSSGSDMICPYTKCCDSHTQLQSITYVTAPTFARRVAQHDLFLCFRLRYFLLLLHQNLLQSTKVPSIPSPTGRGSRTASHLLPNLPENHWIRRHVQAPNLERVPRLQPNPHCPGRE
jgi:hypothetical protein